jgi:adenosylcobyric acid synthase
VTGYEIHHGRVSRSAGVIPWIHLDDSYGPEDEGASSEDGFLRATSLHGLLEADAFRSGFLAEVAERRNKPFFSSGVSFPAERERQLDRIADVVEAHLDMSAIESLIGEAAQRPRETIAR